MSDDPLDPSLGFHLGAAVALGLLVLLLTSCGSTRETTTDTTDRGRVRLETPVVIDSPLGPWTIRPFSATADRRTLAQSSEEATYRPDLAQIAPLVEAGGMGVGGPLAGLAGLAFGAWRMLRERQCTGALKATVTAIEDFKTTASPGEVERLHGKLSRAMDASHKRIVKRVKS